ncbi:hypothetical protein ACFYS8_35280 [Kitasatospora sp. NPDC004615]|uniref:hypothetical protein n=1 Tax=Kitasatospora sp. NPDC004615 TaxID=3364017 RepID=UPI0036A76344
MESQHGFEGLEERKFLRVPDFAGAVRGVVPQSLRLRFTTVGGRARSHIPDCLAVMQGGWWLVDVRPVHLAVKAEDRAGFAAARELAVDLRVVTALIFMAWPATGIRAATPELARALGEEARQRQLDYVERSAVPGKQASATKSYSDPPAIPLVAAAVFEMADRLLRSPDESAASAALGPPAAEARYVSRKVGYSIRRGPGTSTALQTVLLAHHP